MSTQGTGLFGVEYEVESPHNTIRTEIDEAALPPPPPQAPKTRPYTTVVTTVVLLLHCCPLYSCEMILYLVIDTGTSLPSLLLAAVYRSPNYR